MDVNQVDQANLQAVYGGGTTQRPNQQDTAAEAEQTNETSQAAYQVRLSDAAQAQRAREMEAEDNRQEEQQENAAMQEREAMRRAEEQRQAPMQDQGNTYNASGEVA